MVAGSIVVLHRSMPIESCHRLQEFVCFRYLGRFGKVIGREPVKSSDASRIDKARILCSCSGTRMDRTEASEGAPAAKGLSHFGVRLPFTPKRSRL